MTDETKSKQNISESEEQLRYLRKELQEQEEKPMAEVRKTFDSMGNYIVGERESLSIYCKIVSGLLIEGGFPFLYPSGIARVIYTSLIDIKEERIPYGKKDIKIIDGDKERAVKKEDLTLIIEDYDYIKGKIPEIIDKLLISETSKEVAKLYYSLVLTKEQGKLAAKKGEIVEGKEEEKKEEEKKEEVEEKEEKEKKK